MGIGYCKYCRKHRVQVSQIDRHPDNTIIWNQQGESQGICYNCELLIPSTKDELLEALGYLKDSVHMDMVIRELLNILPNVGKYNLDAIYQEIKKAQIRIAFEKYEYAVITNNFNNLKHRIGYIVVAAARMRQENTPVGRKQAAKSVFFPSNQLHAMSYEERESAKTEYGKWFDKA